MVCFFAVPIKVPSGKFTVGNGLKRRKSDGNVHLRALTDDLRRGLESVAREGNTGGCK